MSRLILPWDTESTGIPFWKEQSHLPKQPHLVSLAALLINEDTKEQVGMMNVIVRPDGWEIPQETIDIHGITNEQAMDEGTAEEIAIDQFFELWAECDIRVAHNTTFDNRMIRHGVKRYRPNVVSDEVWKDRDLYFCTLMKSKKIMGGKSGHTLQEAYTYFTGKTMENAHQALVDTEACRDIYFAMKDGGHLD